MSQLKREVMLIKVDEYFLDNETEKITPAQAREVLRDIILSCWNIQEDQIPFPEDEEGLIPPWANNLTYAVGAQVTYGAKFWESRQDNNLNRVPAEGAWWFELSPSHLPNRDTQLLRSNGAALSADAIFNAMSQLLAKMDRGVVFPPVIDLAALKAINTTTSGEWPDRGFLYVKGLKKLYALHRDSAEAADDDKVVAPTTGPGRWVLIAGGTSAPADPALGGELSGTASNATVKNSAILSKLLTGLGSLTGDLLATDNIIQGFSKIRNFMASLPDLVRAVKLVGFDANLTGELSADDTAVTGIGKLNRKVAVIVDALPPVVLTDVSTAAQTRILDISSRQHTNFELNANQAFTLTISNAALGRFATLTLIKTTASDVSVSLPAGSFGENELNLNNGANPLILSGALNSIFVLGLYVSRRAGTMVYLWNVGYIYN